MVSYPRGSDIALPDGIHKRRWRMRNTVTNARRVEATEYDGQQPVLTLVPDEGPKEYPLLWFLCASGFRVTWLPDPLHRVPRDLENAARENDNWAMMLDVTFLLNFNVAPFHSCA